MSMKLEAVQQFYPCQACAGTMEPGAHSVMIQLTPETTVADWQSILQTADKGYHITHGGRYNWHALAVLSLYGNSDVVRYILNNSPPLMTSLGNRDGWTPLVCAAMCDDPEKAFKTAQTILRSGNRTVNICTTAGVPIEEYNPAEESQTSHPTEKELPLGATPLFAAARTAEAAKRNFKLLELLLSRGATSNLKLSQGAEEEINRAKEQNS